MTDLFPETPTTILSHHSTADAVDSFLAWRKATKKPLTERAAKMIAKTLAQINQDGGNADEALDLAQEHGWQTIKPEWYWRIKNGNGNSSPRAINGSSGDATSNAINVAAGARRSQVKDLF